MLFHLLPIHALLWVGQWTTKSLLVTAVTPGFSGQWAYFTLNRVELTQSGHRNDVRTQQIWIADLVFDLHQLGADIVDQCIQILAKFTDVFIFFRLTHKYGILWEKNFKHINFFFRFFCLILKLCMVLNNFIPLVPGNWVPKSDTEPNLLVQS